MSIAGQTSLSEIRARNHLRHYTSSPPITVCASLTFTMFSARFVSLPRCVAGRRLFHASAPVFVKVGDKVPDVDLVEGSPGNKVNLAKELANGKGVIVGKFTIILLSWF